MSIRDRMVGIRGRVAGRVRLDEFRELRSRLARIADGIEENRQLRPHLEERFEGLARTVVELAERRTPRDR